MDGSWGSPMVPMVPVKRDQIKFQEVKKNSIDSVHVLLPLTVISSFGLDATDPILEHLQQTGQGQAPTVKDCSLPIADKKVEKTDGYITCECSEGSGKTVVLLSECIKDRKSDRMDNFPLYYCPPEPQMVLNHINLQLREKVSKLSLTVNGKKAYMMFFPSEGHSKSLDEDQGCNTSSQAGAVKRIRLPYKSFQSVRAAGGGLSLTLINDKPWGKKGIVNVDFSKMQENSLSDFVELLAATKVCEDTRETLRGTDGDSDMDVQVEVTEGTINGYKFVKIEKDSTIKKERRQTNKGNQKKAAIGDKQKGNVTNEKLDRWLNSLRHDDPDLTKKLKIIQAIKIKMKN